MSLAYEIHSSLYSYSAQLTRKSRNLKNCLSPFKSSRILLNSKSFQRNNSTPSLFSFFFADTAVSMTIFRFLSANRRSISNAGNVLKKVAVVLDRAKASELFKLVLLPVT
uniref:GH15538p n=1 Tax=Drosophila melanogaster TaxID=7227 RepID=Q8MR57_DROME|nr:GH15538p [Drosophila melanogaster]